MSFIDLITLITLGYGVISMSIGVYVFRRGGSSPKIFPKLFGVGSGLFLFASLMTASGLSRPRSDILWYTVSNLVLALCMAVVAYISGWILRRRFIGRKLGS